MATRKLLTLLLTLPLIASATDEPKYEVVAHCSFSADEAGIQLGHAIDFSAGTYTPFSEPTSTRNAFALLRWKSGPFKGRADIQMENQNKTGLEQNWKISAHHTANSQVFVFDVTVTPDKADKASETFDQKLLVMYDVRMSPMPAYITRTTGFASEVDTKSNGWVAFLTYSGTCKRPEE